MYIILKTKELSLGAVKTPLNIKNNPIIGVE